MQQARKTTVTPPNNTTDHSDSTNSNKIFTQNKTVRNHDGNFTNNLITGKMSSKIYFITTPKPYKPSSQMSLMKKTDSREMKNKLESSSQGPSSFKVKPKVVIDEGISINININDPESSDNRMSKTEIQTTTKGSTTTTKTTTTTIFTTSLVTTTTSTTSTTTVTPLTTITESSLLMRVLKDQGPQALGVGVASFAYTALAAMPYWLPFVAGRKKRSIREEHSQKNKLPFVSYF